MTAHRFFAIIASVVGLLLSFVTAPFQSPDEPAHFLRIWQLSEGRIVADRYGGEVPVSLCDCFVRFEQIEFHADRKVCVDEIRSELSRPLRPWDRRFESFPNTAMHSPVPYLPQVAAVLALRRFSPAPIVLMYAARCANALAYAMIGWLTLRTLPVVRWPACMVLLAPLPIFLAGSMSADPLTTGFAFLAGAYGLRFVSDPQLAPARIVAAMAGSVLALALCKSIYIPIVLTMFAAPAPAWGRGRSRWLVPLSILAVSVIAMALWAIVSRPLDVPIGNPAAQWGWIKSHPDEYAHVLLATVRIEGPTIVWSSLGILGHLDTKLSPIFIGGYMLLVLWFALNDRGDDGVGGLGLRASGVVVALISALLIVTGQYALSNSTGAPFVEGIQGRYFLPLALVVLIAIRCDARFSPKPALAQIAILCSSVYTVAAVVGRYYL
jgi:uncharacterized membrane protein